MHADYCAQQILAPLAIGLTVFLAHIVAIPVTNCCINRTLALQTSFLHVDFAPIHTWAKPDSSCVVQRRAGLQRRLLAATGTPSGSGGAPHCPMGAVIFDGLSCTVLRIQVCWQLVCHACGTESAFQPHPA